MSEPLIIPPTCNINCNSASPSDIDCQTAYFWDALIADFTLPAIAGTGTINVFGSAMLPNPDDGKVSVASTKVGGMDDFLIVGNSHRYITRSDVVIRNTESFLRNGWFLTVDKALMTK